MLNCWPKTASMPDCTAINSANNPQNYGNPLRQWDEYVKIE